MGAIGLRAAAWRLSRNIVFPGLDHRSHGCRRPGGLRSLAAAEPPWTLFHRKMSFSISGISGTPRGCDGECVSQPVTEAREKLGARRLRRPRHNVGQATSPVRLPKTSRKIGQTPMARASPPAQRHLQLIAEPQQTHLTLSGCRLDLLANRQ